MSGNTDARPRSGGRHHNTTGGAEYSGGLPAACDAGCLLAIATTPAACCLHPCLLAPAACILACLLRRLLARGSAASSFAFVLLLAGCLHSCISGCSGKPEPKMSDFVYFELILGWSFQNPKFKKTEKSDPKILDSPNAQA